jgi:hypothetical protein
MLIKEEIRELVRVDPIIANSMLAACNNKEDVIELVLKILEAAGLKETAKVAKDIIIEGKTR